MGYDGKLTFDTKIDESGFNEGTSKLGSIAKGGLAAIGGLVAGYITSFGALTKSALDEVASLEQNIGGVETLFKKNAETVIANSKKAYETAGLSANNYMATVTSFSASLLQSLGQDTEKAAEYADRAIVDMSDNANKMGTAMESIQNAYQGFAKQNYTMLDNLKLGYGGTKEEMARLISDASKMTDVQKKLGITVDESSMSFGNIVNAISVMQTEMGIAGTTAAEALTTIEGSTNAAKAAWDNFLAGTGTVDELVDSINTVAEVTVENLSNIIPRLADTIPKAAEKLVPTVTKLGPVLFETGRKVMEDFVFGIVEMIPKIPEQAGEIMTTLMDGIQEKVPSMIDIGADMLEGFIQGIGEQLPMLVPKALEMVVTLSDSIISNLPTIINAGIALLKGFLMGIIESLPLLISEGPRIINDFADAIYSGLWELIKAGGELLLALIKGIWKNVPLLLENAGEIFMAFINIFSLSNLYNLGKNLIKNLVNGIKNLGPSVVETGGNIVEFLVNGIKNLATHPVATLKNIASSAMKTIKSLDWKSIGSNIIKGIITGLKNGINSIISTAKDIAGAALSTVKKALGIKSPSRRFRDEVGKNMALGMGEGFEKNMPVDDMNAEMDNAIFKMQKNVSVVTTGDGQKTVGNTKENPGVISNNGGFDFDEYERRQRKLNRERDSRPIFLGTERIDKLLPKGAVPVV